MQVVDDAVSCTVRLPRKMMAHIAESALADNATVEAEILQLLTRGLVGGTTIDELQSVISNEDNVTLSIEDEWERMRTIRELVANELYPD